MKRPTLEAPYEVRRIRPEYVRGALFSSHAHYWEYKTGCAFINTWAYGRYDKGLIYSATVWYKRRRKVLND